MIRKVEGTLSHPWRSVLVVDDDASYRDALRTGLQGAGFTIDLASDGRQALQAFSDRKVDAVLLDLRLPDMSGMEVCRQMRLESDTPILMLSAIAEEVDIVLCLELGADDYIPKPFRLRELIARIDTAVRHRERARKADGRPPMAHGVKTVGPFEINYDAWTVEFDNRIVKLSRKEFEVFTHLALVPGRVCSRAELMRDVWGTESSDDRTLDTHVARLRMKFEKDHAHPVWIITMRGIGFLLNDGKRAAHLYDENKGKQLAQPNRPLT